jgi:hypothetical protein
MSFPRYPAYKPSGSLPPEEIANSRDMDLLGGTEEPKRPTRASVVRSVVRLPSWCSV